MAGIKPLLRFNSLYRLGDRWHLMLVNLMNLTKFVFVTNDEASGNQLRRIFYSQRASFPHFRMCTMDLFVFNLLEGRIT